MSLETCADLFRTLLILFISPFLITLLSPIYLFRWIIGHIVPLFSSHLLKLVPLQSSTYLDAGPKLASTWNTIISATLSQQLNFERFVNLVNERVVCAKNLDGAVLYPELQQCISIWMGYHWWTKSSESFNVRNHVLFQKCVNQSEFEIESDWIQIPFDSTNRSPWEVLVLETEDLNKSMIICKFHHAMADGYSMFKLIMRIADVAVPRFESKAFTNISLGEKCLLNISYPIRGTYELMKKNREIKSVTSPWMVKSELGLSSPRLFAISNRIPTEKLKEINSNLSISSLVTYLVVMTTGIRTFLLTKIPETQIPKFSTAVVPIPSENHPDNLSNHFYLTTVNLPIGLIALADQVSFCLNQITATNVLGVASACKAGLVITKLINGLPLQMRVRTEFSDISLTMFPGPMGSITLDGSHVDRLHFMANGVNFISMVICLLTYNGGVQFTVTAGQDSIVFQDQSCVQELITAIETQIDFLRQK